MFPFPRVTLVAALALGLAPATAQQVAPPAPPAWLYKGSDIAPDPDWKFGTLPNGLRYAVRRNGVPPGQVAIRVRIDAGSLMETESERGFAHLIEHLSFRGSEFVPDGEAKRVWQRLGVTFGSDSNASTTPTQTVYKLDLPSATRTSLDESMKILAGMMDSPGITASALAAERPVVLAEQREQPGPQVRLGDATSELFFSGQPLANRSPIGTIKTLEEATAASAKAFHDRWYRPDRAVVVIAGDGDPALFEALIARHFGGWKPEGPTPAEPDFGKPDSRAMASATQVEPALPPLVTLAVLRPWSYRDDTILFNQNRIVDFLALRMINRRLETRARAGGSFISASGDLDDVSRSVNGTFVSILPIGSDWEAAVRDVRTEIAAARARPASQAEIDREVTEFDAAMKAAVDTARTEAAAKQADEIVEAVDIREVVTTSATAYEILQDMKRKRMFTPARILASTRAIFDGVATRALVSTPTAVPQIETRLAAVLGEDVSRRIAARAAQAPVSFDRLPKLGAPGTIKTRVPIEGLPMEQIEFANGVRMMMFSNPSETAKVYVRVRFGAGQAALPPSGPSAAWAAPLALMASGIGTLGQEELDRLTTGRRIGLGFDIGDDAFSLTGVTSAADLPDQLRVLAAKLARPGWDPNPVTRAKAVYLAGYDAFGSSPDGILARDLEGLLHGGDPRWGQPSRAAASALDASSFRRYWEPQLASGPIEVQVFGDVPADAAIDAVARTFGALPARSAAAVATTSSTFPAHVAAPVTLTHRGPATQAAAVIAWPTGGGIDGIGDSRRLDVLAAIFSDRLFDRLRSEAGASYSPQVASRWPLGTASGGRVIAVGQVAPDKVAFFFTLAREIAADLAATPVSADELTRAVGPLRQYIERASSGNTFWLQHLGGGTYDPRRIAALRGIATDINAIDPAQLQAVAAKFLRAENDWTLAVLPEAK